MDARRLVSKSLSHYWRTNLAVILGVATAVATLSGALLVGDSVRGSLRDLLLRQLGRTDRVVVSMEFFREALADEIQRDERFAPQFAAAAPLVVVQGQVTGQASGRRVSRVAVYGVDERFWRFHGVAVPSGLDDRSALISPALAADIGAAAGQVVLVRVERPTDIPIESLHGRKDDSGRTLRLNVKAIAGPAEIGEFSLRPQQGDVRAVFVTLKRLQQDLGLAGRINTMLVGDIRNPSAPAPASGPPAAALQDLVRRHASLADFGLSVRPIDAQGVLALETAAGVLDEVRVNAANAAAAQAGMTVQPVFTHLANTMRVGGRQGREIPYSLVAAVNLESTFGASLKGATGAPPIVLNEWTARELGAKVGDPLTLEYYLWEEPGRLVTRAADFQIAAIVPIRGAAADRDLTPVYPGITDADTLAHWDPPFPVDLKRVGRPDEDYWHDYRTTPKAFISFETGQALWRSRYGDRTSVRVVPSAGESLAEAREQFMTRMRGGLDPFAAGFSAIDVRADGLGASRGATDFGEYFTYFSFFLVLSALLLATLFFRLGIEQRVREVGLLRAVGYSTGAVRRLFAAEGLVLAAVGSLIGVAGAVAYAWLMMLGLRTWWRGAIGDTPLTLHASAASLAMGAVAIIAAAMLCIWWTLRGLARLSERSLLSGRLAEDDPFGAAERPASARLPLIGGLAFGALGIGLVAAAAAGQLDRTGAFFGAGTSVLIACLCLIAFTLRRRPRSMHGRGFGAMGRLGLRNAAERPGRSVLAIGVIASAVFTLISVGTFRREGVAETDRKSGVGGYALQAELLLPLVYDANSRDGHDALGLTAEDARDTTIDAFRLLPGDDASCLNLYEPRNPRVLGVGQGFIGAGRFRFEGSLASTDAERANPWLLLNRQMPGGGPTTVPVIADANSMTYVLHKALGEDFVIHRGVSEIRLRLVAALSDSLFQSELLMSDENFKKVFPDEEGFRFLLVEAPPARAAEVATAVSQGATDLGVETVSTTKRLAEFHRVENTYLSTFEMLGGLGLLVGTIGLAAVVMRNVLERRRELALLGAVGYRRGHIFAIILAENALLVGWGLVVGTASALIAIVPALAQRGAGAPMGMGPALLVVAVGATGLLSSIVATRAALSAPLLDSLRAE